MEVTAHSKNIRISTRKVRLVADAIRKLGIEEALTALRVSDKRAAGPLEDALKSALANAVNNNNLDRGNLMIASIIVNEGQAMKRYHPSTRGRVHPYKRRASHVTVTLKEKEIKVMKSVVKAKSEAPAKAEVSKTKEKGEKNS